jgi:hypothetical protein
MTAQLPAGAQTNVSSFFAAKETAMGARADPHLVASLEVEATAKEPKQANDNQINGNDVVQ